MIDKNDVKMPAQKGTNEKYTDEEVKNIEELLNLVNAAKESRDLRLNEEYYGQFHWFGASQRNDKSYFSYQEKAVYQFVFEMNKSGILSDQVGMGKTIEAGMIISELASRKELKSLIIIVPNEIMSTKWKVELEEKFGITAYSDEQFGEFPGVTVVRNYDEFCLNVFECLKQDKFGELADYRFKHSYKEKSGDTLAAVLASFVKSDIETVIKMINNGFEMDDMDERVAFDGNKFYIKGRSLKREYSRVYNYDSEGKIQYIVNGNINQNLSAFLGNDRFYRAQNKKGYRPIIEAELRSLFTLIGDYFATSGKYNLSNLTVAMAKRHPIMVVPISYTGEDGQLVDFLNRQLLSKTDNYKHKYPIRDASNKLTIECEDYRIIDFFIDVGYQTMIVDEVHDYIDVESKVSREQFHRDLKTREAYSSKYYDRFELFDDYYFVSKSKLYKKLKSLADKANRKIFLTATPIKSDMVDFYLLTLLASNKDSDAYKKLQTNLENEIIDLEQAINDLYNAFIGCIEACSAEDFCRYYNTFLAEEKNEEGTVISGRYIYPYFNNDYLKANCNKVDVVLDYLKSQINYMTLEEIAMNLMLAYNAEKALDGEQSNINAKNVLEKVTDLLSDEATRLQTRVVFRALLNNTVKMRFEEDFTDEGKPIKRIRDLLEQQDGPRRWSKTYKKYGIRNTRHQTYNLSDCELLNKLPDEARKFYTNLPLWPQRNGKVIFLVRDDVFFDSFIDVQRQLDVQQDAPIRLEDLPNYDQLTDDLEYNQERLNNATAIFDYINESMSGGDEQHHLPQSSKYESVELDDDGMIEYKLALVNRLMEGSDANLGSVKNKVLLFAENGREEILDWFKYQKCAPLYSAKEPLDSAKVAAYKKKWESYKVNPMGDKWSVSTDTADLNNNLLDNVLIIIDPKRYEKGVDMQKANTIINFDINYDPLKMEQRIGRIDRIRPQGAERSINIVSFVPLNNMSGFVINFFANEMKMFTQWMGETTGIVSVPEEEGDSKRTNTQEISFESRVLKLEEFYGKIYELCSKEVSDKKLEEMAVEFSKYFGLDETKTKFDFKYLQHLRPCFDKAYRNSICAIGGHSVDNSDKKVVRFNSTRGLFVTCASDKCSTCANKSLCKTNNEKVNNVYSDFTQGVKDFYEQSIKYYDNAIREYGKRRDTLIVTSTGGSNGVRLDQWLQNRKNQFEQYLKQVTPKLGHHEEPYPMPYDNYREIFDPMKQMYWDEVVAEYLKPILKQFHSQCDSVLQGAKLFERFIKSFSIAEFMNSMKKGTK